MLLSLCLKIFLARIIEVSLGTIVTVLTVKNKRIIATILGFIDVIIWFMVVREALMTNVKSFWIALCYANGYAIGTYLGATLSNKLINGKISMQVILDDVKKEKIDDIRNKGFAVSQVDCIGKDDSKKTMLFIEVDNKNLDSLQRSIKQIDKNAFIVINESKAVVNGFFK